MGISMTAEADEGAPMMEMNTTPLIDVMLVLLIMFIITIPIQTHAVKIDLPTDDAFAPDPVKNDVVIQASGNVLWNGQPIDLPGLARVLQGTKRMAVTPELHLEPEALAPYSRVDQVLSVAKRVGIENMGFVGNERYRSF